MAVGVNSTVSTLIAASPIPPGNADTITNSLAPFANSSVRDAVYRAASTGTIPDYNEPSCVGAGIQTGDYTTAIASAGLKSIPVVGSFLSAALGIFGAHHAAAVKLEQATLCSEVPGIQNLLRAIDQAVLQGANLNDAIQTLENGYSTFVSRVAKIYKSCNAACDYQKYVRAAIEFRKQNYAIIAAQYEQGAQGVVGGVVSAITGAVNSLLPTTPGAGAYSATIPGVAAASVFSLTPSQAQLAIVGVAGLIFVVAVFHIIGAKRGVEQ